MTVRELIALLQESDCLVFFLGLRTFTEPFSW